MVIRIEERVRIFYAIYKTACWDNTIFSSDTNHFTQAVRVALCAGNFSPAQGTVNNYSWSKFTFISMESTMSVSKQIEVLASGFIPNFQ